MTRLEALHRLGLNHADLETIRRGFLRTLAYELRELLESFS